VPRYFFDTSDGTVFIRDREGIEFESLEAAKAEAKTILLEVAIDELPDSNRPDFVVSVRDETGQVVLRIALSLAVDYPSLTRGNPTYFREV
jgi:hypothetical protein